MLNSSHSGDANVHSITTPLVISYSNACPSEFWKLRDWKYTLKLPKRCGPLLVDPSPTSSTPSCLILLGSAQQEKALKTLEKAKAKAMEKVPWKRLIFRDLSGSSMDQGISWSSKDFLLFQLLGISFQRFPRDDPRLGNAWGKRPWKWVSHHWSLWKCHGVAWEDAADGLLNTWPPVRVSWFCWKGLGFLERFHSGRCLVSYHQLSSATVLCCTEASQKLSQALEAHQESKAAVAEGWDPWLSKMHYVPR